MNSIFIKVNMISDFMFEYKLLDLFKVTETLLLSDVPDSFVPIPNSCIACTHTEGVTRKLGVCVYIRMGINFVCIEANCNKVCVVHLIDSDI